MLSAVRARQLFAIHRWTGLLTGLVILFLSLTGSGLVFITEIDRAINGSWLSSEGSGPMITPDRALASIERAYPQAHVGSISLPVDDHGVYLASTNRIHAGGETFNEISVDPRSGQVLGKREHQKSLAFILRQMHLRFFYFGWKGRVVVGAFGVLLLLSTITGLFIYSRFIRALPKWWSIRRGRSFQISTSDWHKLVGIVALAFNLVIAVTGAVLGLENLARYSPAVSEAIHPRPAKDLIPPPPENLDDVVPITAALAAAKSSIAGFEPTYITLPTRKHHYLVYGNLRGRTAMYSASEVGVNAATGQTFFALSAKEARPVTRAYYWMDPLHFGYWGGVYSQILYVIFGLTTGFLSITGFIVWYAKTWRRPRATLPKTPNRRSQQMGKSTAAMIALFLVSAASSALHAQNAAPAKPYKTVPSPAAGAMFLYPERIPLQNGGYADAERGIMFVPANRKDPNSDVIGVEVYRFRASSAADPSTPPIFRLHGGPNFAGFQESLDRAGFYEKQVRPYLDVADFVVVGQRGIGSTKPNTLCVRPAPVALDAGQDAIVASARAAARACQEYWTQHGLDIRGLTVPEAAHDVDDVRKALGYDRIQIWGGSFGSHWGIAMLRYYPETIARAVLRGLEGPNHTYDSPVGVYNALARIAATADTAAAFKGRIPPGGLMNAWKTVIARVEKNPVTVTLTDSARHTTQTIVVDGDAVRATAVMSARSWPAHVLELYNGDYTSAARAAIRERRNPGIETASYYMLDCGSGITAARDAELLADPAAKIVGGRNDEYRAVCDLWPSDNGDVFRTNFETTVPTVLVQGNWDTSTPMENALELKPFFKNSRFVLVKGGSHGSLMEAVNASDEFAHRLIRWFATGDLNSMPEEFQLPQVKWVVR